MGSTASVGTTGRSDNPPGGGIHSADVLLLRQLRLLLSEGWTPLYALSLVGEHGDIGRCQFLVGTMKKKRLLRWQKRGELWYVSLSELGQDFCREKGIHVQR